MSSLTGLLLGVLAPSLAPGWLSASLINLFIFNLSRLSDISFTSSAFLSNKTGKQLGDTSKKYESGRGGPGTINNQYAIDTEASF